MKGRLRLLFLSGNKIIKSNMYNILIKKYSSLAIFWVFCLSCLILNSCNQSHEQVIAAQPGEFQKTIALGNSGYSIELPDSFRIEEAKGKEGQLGFSIIPLNENSSMHGFIEILKGNPHLGDDETKKEVFCTSVLNGKPVRGVSIKQKQIICMPNRLRLEN